MLHQFEEEWSNNVGPIDHKDTENILNISKISSKTSNEKLILKKKINEFECTQWYLHDAYESVNVYSNIDNF
jgi:hypothetical protein